MEDKIKVLEHELFMVQHAVVAYIAKLENPTLEMEKPIIWPVKLDKLQEAINNI